MSKSKCAVCGKWITLVHPTKTNPLGKFRQHTKSFGKICYGQPDPTMIRHIK